jgi:site-specific DNA recombinase
VGTNCHKMQGRNGTWHRYYYCRNHDPIRAGGEGLRCRERNIRADALDRFVFDQIKDVLLHPDLLVSGERAVTVSTPIPDDELLAAELARLDRKIDAAEAERRRLVDIYQAGLIELTDLQRRAAEVAARLRDLRAKQASLAQQRATLARDNQLRRRVHDFAGRIRGIIDRLDDAQKQHLCRLLIEQVRVTGWHVEIRLRIPLDPEPGKPATDHPHPPSPLSSEDGLRSIRGPSTAPATASPSSPEVNHDMITLPRPTREVVPRPTREVVPRQPGHVGFRGEDLDVQVGQQGKISGQHLAGHHSLWGR